MHWQISFPVSYCVYAAIVSSAVACIPLCIKGIRYLKVRSIAKAKRDEEIQEQERRDKETAIRDLFPGKWGELYSELQKVPSAFRLVMLQRFCSANDEKITLKAASHLLIELFYWGYDGDGRSDAARIMHNHVRNEFIDRLVFDREQQRKRLRPSNNVGSYAKEFVCAVEKEEPPQTVSDYFAKNNNS